MVTVGVSVNMENVDTSNNDNDRAVDEIAGVFDECQGGIECHTAAVRSVYKLYRRYGPAATLPTVTSCIDRVLVVMKKEGAVERLVQFIVELCSRAHIRHVKTTQCKLPGAEAGSDPDSEGGLCSHILLHLVKRSIASDKAVRYRCCQLVGGVLSSLRAGPLGAVDNLAMDDGVWGAVYSCVLDRCRDRIQAVRAAAVQAAGAWLPIVGGDSLEAWANNREEGKGRDEATEVIVADLVRVAGSDPAKTVRVAALSCLPVTPDTLPAVLSRTRDVDPKVREAAFLRLGAPPNKADPVFYGDGGVFGGPWLSIPQRRSLVELGLADRHPAVRKAAVATLVGPWLWGSKSSNGDPVKLLATLDPLDSEGPAARAAAAIISHFSCPEHLNSPTAHVLRRAVDPSTGRLGPEEALWWRCQCEAAANTSNGAALASVVPVGVALCGLLEECWQETLQCGREARLATAGVLPEQEDALEALTDRQEELAFVQRQLLAMAALIDPHDEPARRRLLSVVQSLLVEVDTVEDMVAGAVDMLWRLVASEAGKGAGAAEQEARAVRCLAQVVYEVHEGDGDVSSTATGAPDEQTLRDLLEAVRAEVEAADSSQDEEARLLLLEARAEAIISCLPDGIAVRRWIRALQIAGAVMAKVRPPVSCPLPPSKHTMISDLAPMIIPAVSHSIAVVRASGVKALGLFCLLDSAAAAQHAPLLVAVASDSDEHLDIRHSAVAALGDIALLFPAALSACGVEDLLLSLLWQDAAAISLFDTPDRGDDHEGTCNLRTAAAEAVARLLLVAESSPILLHPATAFASLVAVFFAPATTHSNRLRQALSVFFPLFVGSAEDSDARTTTTAASLHLLLAAITGSSLCGPSEAIGLPADGGWAPDIPLAAVTRFLLDLLCLSNPSSQGIAGLQPWSKAALAILTHVLAAAKSDGGRCTTVKELCSVFPLLTATLPSPPPAVELAEADGVSELQQAVCLLKWATETASVAATAGWPAVTDRAAKSQCRNLLEAVTAA